MSANTQRVTLKSPKMSDNDDKQSNYRPMNVLCCFYWGWGEESLLTLVVVRRKMVHTSNKHQPNCFKFARYSCCIISYPNVLSHLWFWFPWKQAPVKYCLDIKICGFSNTK